VTDLSFPALAQPQDVAALILAKASLKFQGNKEIEAMKEVAKAHEKRSLGDFETALKTWKEGR
jgi:26S proteasome regulatory subunit N6